MDSETVFVVDGDEDCLSVIGELLEMEGMRPRLFRGADEAALALAKTDEPPRLLVLDNMNPGTAGAALLQTIRSDVRWCRIPTIVFTAWNDVARPSRFTTPVIRKPEVYALLSAVAATRGGAGRRMGPVRAPDSAAPGDRPRLADGPTPGSSSQ
jgi:CheY-like chemotaxis protein